MADLLPDFDERTVEVGGGVSIHVRAAGRGRPVLLLHGHPQTLSTWHAVAPALAEHHRVVLMDLRGYGASAKPPSSGGDHSAYSKRAMARDAAAVMRALGHDAYAVVGHDRGGRVAHRLALDGADRVERVAVLDIAPTLHMYERTDMAFARAYFWWFFLIQPEPLPERLIGADPAFFLREHLKAQSRTAGVPRADVVAEYLRHYTPDAVHAICEDYRASATVDLAHDRAARENGRAVRAPLLALWGAEGTVGRLYDVLATWREVADDVRGRGLACGHLLQEERPAEVLAELRAFLAG